MLMAFLYLFLSLSGILKPSLQDIFNIMENFKPLKNLSEK